MSDDPFRGFVAFQEEVLSFQRRQLDLAKRSLESGQTLVELQKAGQAAAEAGTKAWLAWVDLWTPKK
jgi:hypothetical protein